MKIFKLSSLFAILAIVAIGFTSCSEDDDPVNGDAPIITALSTKIAPIGYEFTITGSNFGDADDEGSVTINGQMVSASGYTNWSENSITVVVPTGATEGEGNLIVTNDGVSSAAETFYVAPMAPATPIGLKATSIDNETVSLTWDKLTWNSHDVEYWEVFDKYLVKVYDDQMNLVDTALVTKTAKPHAVTGLTEGMIYTFKLYARYTNNYVSLTPAEIMWSPASRWNMTPNEVEIKLYSTSNDTFGSGLDLYDSDDEGPAVVTVALGNDWNLGLSTRDGQVLFGSASELNYPIVPSNSAEMSTEAYFYDDLDEAFDSEDLATKDGMPVDFSKAAYELTQLEGNGTNVIFVVRAKEPGNNEYNYAKVMVKLVDGKFLQGEGSDAFIELVISYQNTPGVPYAK